MLVIFTGSDFRHCAVFITQRQCRLSVMEKKVML